MALKILSEKLIPRFRNMLKEQCKFVRNYSTEMPPPAIFRQHFSPRTELQLNIQIGQELYASHSYLAMSNFFSRTDIALNGSAGLFLAMSNEERTHALDLIKYQNMRGGKVLMYTIMKPRDEFNSLSSALEHALVLERQNTKLLMEVVDIAEKEHDITTVDFIISEFLYEQMESLQSLGTILTRLKRTDHAGGLGEYMLDQELQKQFPYVKDDKNSS